MIKFFKNLFTTKLVKREYDPYEKMHLRRLEQYEEYSLYKDKKYFTYIDNVIEMSMDFIVMLFRFL